MLYVGEETVKLEESCWDRLAVYACKEQWAPFAELLDSTYRARSSQDRSTLQTLIWIPASSLSLPAERPCPHGACPKRPGGCPCVQPDGEPGRESAQNDLYEFRISERVGLVAAASRIARQLRDSPGAPGRELRDTAKPWGQPQTQANKTTSQQTPHNPRMSGGAGGALWRRGRGFSPDARSVYQEVYKAV